jgi:hypothetical protein
LEATPPLYNPSPSVNNTNIMAVQTVKTNNSSHYLIQLWSIRLILNVENKHYVHSMFKSVIFSTFMLLPLHFWLAVKSSWDQIKKLFSLGLWDHHGVCMTDFTNRNHASHILFNFLQWVIRTWRRLGEPQSCSGHNGEEKNSQPPMVIKPYSPDHPAHNLVATDLKWSMVPDL